MPLMEHCSKSKREEESMSCSNYDELRQHIGHRIVCVCYGEEGEDPDNITIECATCCEVLLDFDKEEK